MHISVPKGPRGRDGYAHRGNISKKLQKIFQTILLSLSSSERPIERGRGKIFFGKDSMIRLSDYQEKH
jgi:hypothetical protein